MAPKKIGRRGQGLRSQTKEIINNISKFMEEEAAHFNATKDVLIPLKNFR